jgi:VanZ family protein
MQQAAALVEPFYGNRGPKAVGSGFARRHGRASDEATLQALMWKALRIARQYGPSTMKSWLRVVAIASLVAILALSLVPGSFRPHTIILPPALEHVSAYTVAAFLLCLAYPSRLPPVRLVLLLTAYGAFLEFGQVWIPDRNASLTDVGADLVGGLVGAMAALAALHLGSFPLARRS